MHRPSFAKHDDETLTGRYVVTFQSSAIADGISLLKDKVGLSNIIRAADFNDQDMIGEQLDGEDGTVFEELDVCVVKCPTAAADRIEQLTPRSAIMAIEEEHRVYALADAAVNSTPYIDSANESWGYQAAGLSGSQFTGRGVRVCVLDTGIDLLHPDFKAASVVATKSFVAESGNEDANGHGTHCAGTICGPRLLSNAPGYGVAPGADMFIGKVLDSSGRGDDRSVLAGINWAVANGCHVVSLSIGANVSQPSQAFEHVGLRALKAGTLLIAAAGNNSQRSQGAFREVTRPANNQSIMAVGAIDHSLSVADFSARSSKMAGGEVDVVAPGVEVFSAWPLPTKYRGLTGTSMATPFVAGIAALYAEAFGVAGLELWERLLQDAVPLPASKLDVGAGLVQAPRS